MNLRLARTAVKFVLLLALAVGVGMAVYLGTRTSRSIIPVNPVVTANIDTRLQPIPKMEPSSPEQLLTTPPIEESSPTPEPTFPVPNLDGTWQMIVVDADGVEYPRHRLHFTRNGTTFSVSNSRGSITGTAIVKPGQRLIITKTSEGGYTQVFEGQLNPHLTEAIGEYREMMNDQVSATWNDIIKIVKLDEAQVAQEEADAELLARRRAEVETLAKAIMNHVAAYDGRFPSSISQLDPEFLPDRSLLEQRTDRKITYLGAKYSGSALTFPQEEEQALRKNPTRENLMELERRLQEVWGGEAPVDRPIIRIDFDNPPLTLVGNDRGTIGHLEPEEPNEELSNEDLRNAEFNNLKQLGLALKMFQDEHNDYLPAGWFSLYPEYISDTSILRSPWVSGGNLSYDLIYPARSEQELTELSLQIVSEGLPADMDRPDLINPARLASKVPVAVSRELLPDIPGYPPASAALFLDGHVEAVSLDEWETEITPYIR